MSRKFFPLHNYLLCNCVPLEPPVFPILNACIAFGDNSLEDGHRKGAIDIFENAAGERDTGAIYTVYIITGPRLVDLRRGAHGTADSSRASLSRSVAAIIIGPLPWGFLFYDFHTCFDGLNILSLLGCHFPWRPHHRFPVAAAFISREYILDRFRSITMLWAITSLS